MINIKHEDLCIGYHIDLCFVSGNRMKYFCEIFKQIVV